MQRSLLPFFNYEVRNQANSTLDLFIDGDIVDAETEQIYREWFGIESTSYKSMRDQVLSAKPTTLNVYINCPGGQVIEAMAMHDFLADLENKDVTVNRYGRGLIASAATYLLMGKNSSISENSWFMIHNVAGGIWGDVNDIENAARTMRKFNDQVRDLYVKYTSLAPETISAWMNKESWFTGKEAVEKGFVSNVTGSVEFENSIPKNRWMFSNNAVLNAYNSSVKNNQPDMKFNLESLLNTVKKTVTDTINAALGIGTDKETKPSDLSAENLTNTISTAVVNALDSVQQTLSDAIDNGISDGLTNSLKEEGAIAKLINSLIDGAIKNATADKGVLSELVTTSVNALTGEKGAVTEAIANATKELVTNKTLEDLKTDLSDKIGTAGNRTKKEGQAEDKSVFNHPGVGYGSN